MVKRYAINQKNLSQFACVDGRKDTLYFLDGECGLALRCPADEERSWVFQSVSPMTGHIGAWPQVALLAAGVGGTVLHLRDELPRCNLTQLADRNDDLARLLLPTLRAAERCHAEWAELHLDATLPGADPRASAQHPLDGTNFVLRPLPAAVATGQRPCRAIGLRNCLRTEAKSVRSSAMRMFTSA